MISKIVTFASIMSLLFISDWCFQWVNCIPGLVVLRLGHFVRKMRKRKVENLVSTICVLMEKVEFVHGSFCSTKCDDEDRAGCRDSFVKLLLCVYTSLGIWIPCCPRNIGKRFFDIYIVTRMKMEGGDYT